MNQGGTITVTEILQHPGHSLSGTNGFTGSGLNNPIGIAVDGSGNAWVTNQNSNTVTEISSAGAFLSGSNGFTGGGLNDPFGIAIDSVHLATSGW